MAGSAGRAPEGEKAVSIKALMEDWGGAVLGGLALIGVGWNKVGIKFLSAKWDGFKLEYDRLNRSDAAKGGRLDEQADQRERAEHDRERIK